MATTWLRGADMRVKITTDFGQAFIGCERIGLQSSAPVLPVTNTEGIRGNTNATNQRGAEANIADIDTVRITLMQPTFNPANNVFATLSLPPNTYCQMVISGIATLNGTTASTASMNVLYHQCNTEAQIPGKAPPTMTFVGDGVTAAEAMLLSR